MATAAHKSVISARKAAVAALGNALVCGAVACVGGTGTSIGKLAFRGCGEALDGVAVAGEASMGLAVCCGCAAVPVLVAQPAARMAIDGSRRGRGPGPGPGRGLAVGPMAAWR